MTSAPYPIIPRSHRREYMGSAVTRDRTTLNAIKTWAGWGCLSFLNVDVEHYVAPRSLSNTNHSPQYTTTSQYSVTRAQSASQTCEQKPTKESKTAGWRQHPPQQTPQPARGTAREDGSAFATKVPFSEHEHDEPVLHGWAPAQRQAHYASLCRHKELNERAGKGLASIIKSGLGVGGYLPATLASNIANDNTAGTKRGKGKRGWGREDEKREEGLLGDGIKRVIGIGRSHPAEGECEEEGPPTLLPPPPGLPPESDNCKCGEA